MGIFKNETDTKRMIFNVRSDLAERLEKAKEDSRRIGKKLDIDNTIDKALEKFLKKAEKRLSELSDKLIISSTAPNELPTDNSQSPENLKKEGMGNK